jgi:NAD(P)-dependent dehydrogenase (short-subunit alcohol dehydrogenase family)
MKGTQMKSGKRNGNVLAFVRPKSNPRFAGKELRDKVTAIIPVARIGAREEIAAAVLYLCSDNAKFTTGTSLVVDGGFIAQ